MLNDTLLILFERDLNKLKTEISSYKDEKNMWLVEGAISNSAGNLCTHLIGSLNHFIGAILGGTSYVRERDKEFSVKNISKEKLISDIEDLLILVKQVVSKLTKNDFDRTFPMKFWEQELTTEAFFISIAVPHLAYHLGQINYHRRLLDK
jgi:hypothetical protein